MIQKNKQETYDRTEKKKETRERDSKDFLVKKKNLIVDDEIENVYVILFSC